MSRKRAGSTLIVWAPGSHRSGTASDLGTPDYSYAFVLKHFLPVLDEMGTVVRVSDPNKEVDPIHRRVARRGGTAHFLCFAPPHRAPVGLECPTSLVFAWEFDTIPEQAWGGEPRNDWTMVLNDHGSAITLSTQTKDVIRRTMGEDFHVSAIPAPIFDRVASRGSRSPRKPSRRMTIAGDVADSRDFSITAETMTHRDPESFSGRPWDGGLTKLRFDHVSKDQGLLVGFYEPEPFGSWSRLSAPWVILPFHLSGRVDLSLLVGAYGDNIDREVSVTVAGQQEHLTLSQHPAWHTFTFNVDTPTNALRFGGLSMKNMPDLSDVRSMGLSLCEVTLQRQSEGSPQITPPGGLVSRARSKLRARRRGTSTVSPQRRQFDLGGIVYTSVLNPTDARKNWQDMVACFCEALGDRPDATLVLKMTHHSISSFFGDLQSQLYRIGAVNSRVLAVRGYLDENEYEGLMDATTYYVNASSAEGLCMPLMEFMAAGVPAVAPRNSAMRDYVSRESSFVVRSTGAITSWPHDPNFTLNTHFDRVDLGALTQAFRDSYHLATTDERRYSSMGQAAGRRMRAFCSDEAVTRNLHHHLRGRSHA